MITLTQVVALLQAVVSLLTLSVGTPQEGQALQVATQAVIIAQKAIVDQQNTLFLPPELTPVAPQSSNPQSTATSPIQQPPAPKLSMKSLKIISPINGKGLGRRYTAQSQIYDESNYVELGLIFRNENGDPISNALVTVEATDQSQNKQINGTGFTTPIPENGSAIATPYYQFHYEFKTTGQHVITFSTGDMTESVTLEVHAPDPT